MIPIRLTIEGFLSYQQAVTIDFTDFQLACVSGANGAGKSSILDAITWALFGIARSRSDAIINQNCQAAEVGFDFEYENQNYRLRRFKSIDKALVLELFKFDLENDRWRPLTEHTVTETQKRIVSILRLDYDSFVNAAFFLQGKADSFANLTPTRRKDILSNILGLEVWESYRDSVSVTLREEEMKLNQITGILQEIESEIASEDQIIHDLEQLQLSEKAKQETKQNLVLILDQARQLEQSRKNSEQQISMFEKDLLSRSQQFQQKREKQTKLQERLISLHLKLENADKIKKDFQAWKDTRAELENWLDKREQFLSLEKEKSKLEQAIAMQKTTLETQLMSLQSDAKTIEKQRLLYPQLKKDLSDLQSRLHALESRLGSQKEFPLQVEALQNVKIQKTETIKQLTLLNDQLREHLKEFQKAGPECPFCKQPLTVAHRETYQNLTKTEGLQRKEEITRLQTEVSEINTQITELKNKIEHFSELDRERQQLEQKKAQTEVQLSQVEDLLQIWDSQKAPLLTSIGKELKQADYANHERKKVAALLPAMEAIGYDAQKHQQSKTEENRLRTSENLMRELETAQATYEPLRMQAAELEREISELSEEIEQKISQLESLRNIHREQFSDIPDLINLQKQLDLVQIELNQINIKIGGEKQKLVAIKHRKESQVSYQAQKSDLRLAISRYEKLKEAFGKNGIPAQLIEQALPQIEEHANLLLDRLTNGGMTIRFETQSDYKDKKRQDKKETLDILINDLNGNTRAYEMFSGGEAFRINFAIRMALSQVLAKRSGAKLQTLVIDEGFGSQDAEGRQRVIEAINHVRSNFAKILVITHLEELKDAFPARIEVEMTSKGSQVQVQVF